MQIKYQNKHKLKTIIATILILNINTACTTTRHRDKELIKTLTLQNEVINSVIVSKAKDEDTTKRKRKDNRRHQESTALKALATIKESNDVLISKLKPNTKKECNCGKNERTSN